MKYISIVIATLLTASAFAQTNTFPSSGNVGIGTTNPWAPLTFTTTSASNGNTGVSLAFEGTSKPEIGYRFKANGTNYYQVLYNGSSIQWKHYENSSYVPKLTLSNEGNLGIGTTSPDVKLDIIGDEFASHNVASSSIPLRLRTTFESIHDKDSAVDFVVSRWEVGGDNRPETRLDIRLSGNASQTYDSNTPNTDVLSVRSDGRVGIGTTTPDEKLTVAGTGKFKEVIVEEDTGADFVFEEDYDLPDLSELEAFIKANKHLPEIPTAEQMKKNGVKIGEFQIKLLQKIEELTLHTINQQELIKEQRQVLDKLIQQNEELSKRIIKLERND